VQRFLSPRRDAHAVLCLDVTAAEFKLQPLNLDWTIITSDTDLRWRGSDWSYHGCGGATKAETSRTDVKKPKRRQYLKNAYRAVVFVPRGAKRDLTRRPGLSDGVIRYLTHLGCVAS
jgi:hypothetical protein